jgi:hypothetical protein
VSVITDKLFKKSKELRIGTLSRIDTPYERQHFVFSQWLSRLQLLMNRLPGSPKIYDLTTHTILEDVPQELRTALPQFLYTRIDDDLHTSLTPAALTDGIVMLLWLQEQFAPATKADKSRILREMSRINLRHGETATSFLTRFRRLMLECAQHGIPENTGVPYLDQFLLLMKQTSNPEYRSLIGVFYLQMENHRLHPDSHTPLTFNSMEASFRDVDRHAQPSHHRQPMPHGHGRSPFQHQQHRHHRGHRSGAPTHNANAAAAPSGKKPRGPPRGGRSKPTYRMNCFKCGGNHSIRDCPTASQAEKKRAFEAWHRPGNAPRNPSSYASTNPGATRNAANSERPPPRTRFSSAPGNSPSDAVPNSAIQSAHSATTTTNAASSVAWLRENACAKLTLSRLVNMPAPSAPLTTALESYPAMRIPGSLPSTLHPATSNAPGSTGYSTPEPPVT